jgi:UPF0755 protein
MVIAGGLLILLLLLVGVGFSYFDSQSLPVDINSKQTRIIKVSPGMTSSDIGTLLASQGLIRDRNVFLIAAKMQGLDKALQAGEYAMSPSMNLNRVIEVMAKGQTAYQEFTVPEGYTIDQIAALLAEKGLADKEKFLSLAKRMAPADYGVDRAGVKYRMEGFLFPDTYRVSRGASEEDIMAIMVNQFRRQFSPDLQDKAKISGLSVYDLMILASLVEREAQLAHERPMVARVFLNRIKIGMPLQSCATIQYILGYPKEELTIADTQLPSPYNTYIHPGLPPGPVASPGLPSIKAVLAPADGDWLYFVVDGKTGGHRFSKTLAEHEAAIQKIGQ